MRFFVALAALVLLTATALAARTPWQRRIGRDVEIRHHLSRERVTADMWPAEPVVPAPVTLERFRAAIGAVCPPMPIERLDLYSGTILAESARFGVDPFLLAALVVDGSGCLPMPSAHAKGHGLTRLDVDMHAPHIRRGTYTYFVRENGEWTPRALDMGLYPFNRWKADQIPSNLYFSAAILSVFATQCPDLDKAFPGIAHRHFVSHWFFGDAVSDTEPEDRVLTVRRRLLAHYHETVPAAVGAFMGVPIVSPLDGVPRLVLDDFGNKRGKKNGFSHMGLDIDAATGEPVRSVAAGRVVFAGADLPGGGTSAPLTPEEAASYPARGLGPGGLYVCVNHVAFKSCYMHLESIAVKDWDQVTAGQILGAAGATGTKVAGPHVHLELRIGTDRVDPTPPLADALVDPKRILENRK
ncbi:MAG: M23 family metallopeptidase [Deltaproteobacteria bacterium]|nr:M23 family metallopeptidase [Deltaproteobacteria bacterium]